MNTNTLKSFAAEARIKLIDQIARKLDFVLTHDTAELRGKQTEIAQLNDKIKQIGREQVIETVAYTWFNRLMALRFMDANGYTLPKVVTPLPGMTNPEILQNALAGHIEADFRLDRNRLNDLLDGRTASTDAHTEAYKMLIVAACNHWYTAMPFMFERISDYTELLLPDDLLSDYSIVADIRNGMTDEDCQQEEILGWLYQFYISAENARLIKSKKAYAKHELAPASQLFTPKWIVKYMVDNTLGQLWSEMNPSTSILKQLEFYITPAYKNQLTPRTKKRLEEIRFFDPCVGSGHILVYAFDVFYLMYEEQGYNVSEIPELIIKHNLFGTDIDERAAQIAAFVLTMKGRRKNSRFLRKGITPNVTFYQDFEEDTKFSNAKAIGSLINVEPEEMNAFKVETGTIYAEQQQKLKQLYTFLGQRYDCVVTNPPYISSSRMEGSLKQYVEAKYQDTKSDLFATFVIRCIELCNADGLTGYMTPFVWMFISSYQKLRETIIDNHFINNLIQLEYSGFDGATVPICTFTLRNNQIDNAKGSYIRLSDFKGSENQAPRTLEAIQNPDCGWFYIKNQCEYDNAPESIICYWLSYQAISYFKINPSLSSKYATRVGLSTSDSPRFLRLWQELSFDKVGLNFKTTLEAKQSMKKWFPLNKGGGFRKWFGNNEYAINYLNDGEELKHWLVNNPNDPTTTSFSRYIRSPRYYFKPSLNWTKISSGSFSIRFSEDGFIFSDASNGIFPDSIDEIYYLIGLLNSKVAKEYLSALSPTLNFKSGDIGKIPVLQNSNSETISIVKQCLSFGKSDWNSHETSWDFQQNELIRCKSNCGQNCADLDMLDEEYRVEILGMSNIPTDSNLLKDCFNAYKNEWSKKFYELHRNEEELNRQFIEIYGLQDELTPDVPLEEITILQEEGKIIDSQLEIQTAPVMLQLISYAVGCMFGRYSLDKPGLILANQGDTIDDYNRIVGNFKSPLGDLGVLTPPLGVRGSFTPDSDNIIPVLDGEWFSDDIVGRFREFIKVAFSAEQLNENIGFIEDNIPAKDIRKYFVKDFYNDHIKRYKKRPIYWMFSSPKGHFKALIYMHRYQPDTCSVLLNDYLQPFISKLESARQTQTMLSLREDLSPRDKVAASKEIDNFQKMIDDCKTYERTLFTLATKKISMDLDDGVKVNYQKFKEVLVPIKGLEKEEE
ncbi:MAG: BREX-1 system adenine-specific DNA-methyltransferase PglX [Parabacteroides sp.]|nr:BREX-1 system adenine-specific DNA-methyltransferase PglX [Parabacteroides sp.]